MLLHKFGNFMIRRIGTTDHKPDLPLFEQIGRFFTVARLQTAVSDRTEPESAAKEINRLFCVSSIKFQIIDVQNGQEIFLKSRREERFLKHAIPSFFFQIKHKKSDGASNHSTAPSLCCSERLRNSSGIM